MNSILSELQLLKFHPGFPHGNYYIYLFVPKKTKYLYLNILQNQSMCSPTLKIDKSSWFASTKEENSITITNFLDNCDEEGSGWVVKQPFVTD